MNTGEGIAFASVSISTVKTRHAACMHMHAALLTVLNSKCTQRDRLAERSKQCDWIIRHRRIRRMLSFFAKLE